METPDSPKTLRTPILLFVACVLLIPTLGLTACAEPASSSASSTTVQADSMATLPDAVLTPVVGTFYLVEERYTPARTKVGDLEQIRDEDWVLRYEMSDPRLSGDQDTIINGDLRADGSADLWGSAMIHNDGGTWECSHWTGTIAEGGLEHYIWAVYEGTGAYAGLTYYQQNHFVELPGVSKPPEEGVAVTGWIVDTASSVAALTAVNASTSGLAPAVGTFYLVEERYTPARTKVGDLVQIRDEDWVLYFEMSDPRMSGNMEQLINGDLRADGSADLWGSAIIHNDGGTWECSHWTGTIAKGGLEHFIWAEWKGTGGAYAGLTSYGQCHFVELPGAGKPPTEGVAATGWIQETD